MEGSFLGRGQSLYTGVRDLDDTVVQGGMSSSPIGIHSSSVASCSGESIRIKTARWLLVSESDSMLDDTVLVEHEMLFRKSVSWRESTD